MADREVKHRIWDAKVSGTDPDAAERGIKSKTDWRNPDIEVKLDGGRVEVRDEAFRAHRGASEPDWSKGYYVWIDNGGQTKILFESSGDQHPPDWVKTAKMEGRVLFGSIILRDMQNHG
jgi:hypothetical protein